MVAPDLQAALAVNATRLGLLTASYFYIYTALQPAAGLAADWLGPRRAVGWLGLVGGAGSIVFGLADSFAMASVGRLLVGAGTAFLFVGLMKYNSLWFSAERYGRISGLTLLIGNLGALLAAAPLAWWEGYTAFVIVPASIAGSVVEYLVRKTWFRYYPYGGPIDRLFMTFFPARATEAGRRSQAYIEARRKELGAKPPPGC